MDEFEKRLAKYIGVKHAVATVNGTSALHVALLVAGVRPDDEVLVSNLSFIAPANAIRYVGAWPVFIDAEKDHWQMDVSKVRVFLEKHCRMYKKNLYDKVTAKRVKAIIPVHILGHPCDMDPLLELARKYNLVVIEDAAESLGAKYKDRMVGQLGDLACFSFNGNKILTTGGGGMIVTNNTRLADYARYLTTQAKDNPVEYIHNEIGYNYRLTNIQAAIGCAQLEKIEEFIAAKRQIAEKYSRAFLKIQGLTPMAEAPWAESTYWLYTILIDSKKFGIGSRRLMLKLGKQGIESRPLWTPLSRNRMYLKSRKMISGISDSLHADSLSIPSSADTAAGALQRVIETVWHCQKRKSLRGLLSFSY